MKNIEEEIDNKKVVFSLITLFIIFAIASVILIIFLKEPENTTTTNLDEPSFTFAASGDFNVTNEFKQGLRQIKDSKADFALAVGDFSYGKVTEQQWCNEVHKVLGQTYPFQLVAGNHDVEKGAIMSRFSECLPNRIPDMIGEYGRQYYFDYQDIARVIAITPDIRIDGREYTYEAKTEELKWLINTIDEAKQDNKWVVIAMHKNCLAPGIKTCEVGEDLFKMLVNKKVDLILQGHEHSYFRSDQLSSTDSSCSNMLSKYNESCVNKAENGAYPKGEGTILVINGTGGTDLRNHDTNSQLLPYFSSIHSKNQNPAFGPSIFTVSQNEIKAQFIDINGEIQDQFYIR